MFTFQGPFPPPHSPGPWLTPPCSPRPLTPGGPPSSPHPGAMGPRAPMGPTDMGTMDPGSMDQHSGPPGLSNPPVVNEPPPSDRSWGGERSHELRSWHSRENPGSFDRESYQSDYNRSRRNSFDDSSSRVEEIYDPVSDDAFEPESPDRNDSPLRRGGRDYRDDARDRSPQARHKRAAWRDSSPGRWRSGERESHPPGRDISPRQARFYSERATSPGRRYSREECRDLERVRSGHSRQSLSPSTLRPQRSEERERSRELDPRRPARTKEWSERDYQRLKESRERFRASRGGNTLRPDRLPSDNLSFEDRRGRKRSPNQRYSFYREWGGGSYLWVYFHDDLSNNCNAWLKIGHLYMLTLNVRGPSYLGLTRSILWLLMPWLLTSSGHQQPWYWLCRIGRFLS